MHCLSWQETWTTSHQVSDVHTSYSKLLAKYHFEMAVQPSLNKEVKMSTKRLPTIYFHRENPSSSNVIFGCVFNASANLFKSLVFWHLNLSPATKWAICKHTHKHANTHTHLQRQNKDLGRAGWEGLQPSTWVLESLIRPQRDDIIFGRVQARL